MAARALAFGLGVADPLGSFFEEPRTGSHVFMRAAPDDFDGGSIVLVDNASEIFPPTAAEAGNGTHRLRINYDAVSQNHGGGLFIPTSAFSPLDTSDNGFDGTNARIFFGGASGITFDDLSVQAFSGMDALWTGSIGTSWGTAGNWNPTAVPATTDNLFFTDSASTFTVDTGSNRTANSLTFAGASNYTVNNNTLSLGSGDITTTGSATHTINSNVELLADGIWDTGTSSGLTVGGSVSGAFSLTKQGAGTLTLNGANTYSGGRTISGGTLQIGNGGITGSFVGDLTNNAALIFNRSDDVTFAGNIGGNGSLTKTGGGLLTLSGNNITTGSIDTRSVTGDGGALTILDATATSSVDYNLGQETPAATPWRLIKARRAAAPLPSAL